PHPVAAACVAPAPRSASVMEAQSNFRVGFWGSHASFDPLGGGISARLCTLWTDARCASIAEEKNMTGQSHLFLKVISALVVATAATEAAAQQAAAVAQGGAQSDSSEQPAEVVVTGSRIARRDYEANTPI